MQSFGNEVHAGRTCVCTSHVKMPVLARVLPFFFFFFKASYHPALTSFTPPLQNKTPPAWPMKKTLVTKRHDTLLWPVTLFQYWVNCFVLLFIILFTSTYKHHQLCKFPLLCLCQACPAQLLIGGKDAQACRTQHAQHVA